MSNFWRALYDYDGLDSTQLSFQAGDVFLVSEVHDGGWFTAERGADIGYVPSNYLEPLRDSDTDGAHYDDGGGEEAGEEAWGPTGAASDGPEAEYETEEDGRGYTVTVTECEAVAESEASAEAATESEEEPERSAVDALEEERYNTEGEREEDTGAKPPSMTLQPTVEGARVTCISSSSGGRQRLSRLAGSPAPNIVSVQKLRSPVVIRHRSKPNYAPEAAVALEATDASVAAAAPGDGGDDSAGAVSLSVPLEPPPLPLDSPRAFTPSPVAPPIPPRLDLCEGEEEATATATVGEDEETSAPVRSHSSSGATAPLRSSAAATAMPLRTPSGRLPPPVADDYQAPREHIDLLGRGGVFQRYTAKRKKPQQRFFSVVMQPEIRIQWRDVDRKKFSSDNSLPLAEATGVLKGHNTAVFQRHVKNGTARSPCLAFSVVFSEGPDGETLDLEAATEGLRSQWFDALSSLFRQISAQ